MVHPDPVCTLGVVPDEANDVHGICKFQELDKGGRLRHSHLCTWRTASEKTARCDLAQPPLLLPVCLCVLFVHCLIAMLLIEVSCNYS